jgi:hypothetical protein
MQTHDNLNSHCSADALDPIYLPFSAAILGQHFAPVGSRQDPDTEKYLSYYRQSAEKYRAFLVATPSTKGLSLSELKNPCQIEKDERFWTAACWLRYFYSDRRIEVLSKLMESCFGSQPPLKRMRSWSECFDGDLRLYFEAHLPSSQTYKRWLRQNLAERNLIPYVLRAAERSSNRDFEGSTRLDVLIINADNGFALVVEAKVLSDISYMVSFDIARNQIGRTVDVILEHNTRLAVPLRDRDPDETLFIFQSPAMFKTHRHTRLYGWLLDNYIKEPATLGRDLPHRSDTDWRAVVNRIGWITWEDCAVTLPGSCPWLLPKSAVA